jgi:hypothetical protein
MIRHPKRRGEWVELQFMARAAAHGLIVPRIEARAERRRLHPWPCETLRSKNPAIRDNKRRGEWAELKFMSRASEKGLSVAKPWGESGRYDVIVENGGRMVRVQVKCTYHRRGNSYVCRTLPDDHERGYRRHDFDYFAAYIVPEYIWYILPARKVMRLAGNLWLSPHKRGHKYEKYMEAWELLKHR